MSEVQESTLADDLAAAFEAVENGVSHETDVKQPETEQKVEETTASDVDWSEEPAETDEKVAEIEEKPAETAETEQKAEETEQKAEETTETDDTPPPAGWKPLAREEWKAVPKSAREEIVRREREIATTLQQTTDIRKFAENFAQTIYPFRDHIRREGATPLSAVQSLMQTAATLQTGTQSDKALQIATLVARYGVDIKALDEALASGAGREDPVVQQRVQAAVRPYQEQLEAQQRALQEQQSRQTSGIQQELQAFAADKTNEFFQDVRTVMADIMDAEARSGRLVSFKEAYDRACKLNPDVSRVLELRQKTTEARARAEEAKKKQMAAKSVQSSSGGGQRRRAAEASNPHDDLRADLEAAYGG